MTTQHTPAPWDINGQTITSGETAIAQFFQSKGNVEHQHYDNPKKDEAQANARLIAAAPELLEALKKIHAICGNTLSTHEIARAAIAKAEGK